MEPDEIVDLGYRNENRWGTEPRQILNAIGDAYRVFVGDKKIAEEDSKKVNKLEGGDED